MDPALYQLHANVEERHWWFVARRQIIRSLLREVVPPASNRLVIDLGCGTGGNAAALARDYDVLGIDAEPAAIHFAAARFPHVRFRNASDPAEVPEVSGAAALVLTDVLEHIEHDLAFLHSWIAAAPPGAHFLITVPAEPALWSAHDEVFGHYRRYTRDTLRALWRDQPVELKLLSAYNARLYAPIRLARTLSRVTGRSSGESGSDLGQPPRIMNGLLRTIFEGEIERLKAVLRGGPGYDRGVSLIAILRRT